ncbi:DUF2760 domain-containing protein [Roseiconus lacunae]|uniref:DUF2760 domain-containing protein n=1 Tax=Roseiconus lacunae TaxID=2605694 RepID=A0ABT7PKL9_9BACT|nr:DUF2760 domain-containing protein [Roseiconus lacunae]MCD0460994.1 DUF2760 domain-containing protein [Roseiconus lacunae]MDM4016898.1 DUF2760 domain-containing protein [Roseiconus lacunae]WRQ48834.1 DUF2760 domain-containing protein [Stieleria sp. HD01]
MSFSVALKAFFAAIGNKDKSNAIQAAMQGTNVKAIDAPKQPESSPQPVVQPPPKRDSALTLLAALQREARLVDLIHEDLDQYADAQVGAAARPCLKQCAGVLDRLLGIKPLVEAGEGETVTVGPSPSPMRYQWIGEGEADSAKLVHHGWQASKVELPSWSGADADANIIAPAQVQRN